MPEIVPFSTALRERSRSAHSGSEHAGFMADLMQGRGTRDDYVALVAQHWFIYEALEVAAERMKDDPIAALFISEKLTRLPALEADLAFLIGDDWRERIEPLPTTERYVARIDEVAAQGWAGGFVAHHYTRYLGDLSGGQAVGRILDRAFDLDGQGLSFYDFAEIGKNKPYKDTYRAQLDAIGAGLTDDERLRVVDEVCKAFRLNQALFAEIGANLDQYRR